MLCRGDFFSGAILLSLLGTGALAQNGSTTSIASGILSYAPIKSSCTYGSLVRPANGLSWQEGTYITSRKIRANRALDFWLENTNEGFLLQRNHPTIAFASSGGGYRSMLISAGVIQALDERDSDEAVNGIYQAITYHTGLSGGSWLLSSLAGNGYETVSTISEMLWQNTLQKNALSPVAPENLAASNESSRIKQDLLNKAKAGYSPVVTDVWGRFLEAQLISRDRNGLGSGSSYLLSDIRRTRAFRRFDAPFPIITALGVEDITNICDAPDNATAYEFTPYEFGSWDKGVEAFTPTEHLGTNMTDGRPYDRCERRFDQLSYIMGTSSAKFNEECGNSLLSIIFSALEPLVKPAYNVATTARRNIFSPWPNPFRGRAASPKVSHANELYLVDGGQANQNNPIWPLLQPARNVDVILVNDNSADTDDNWPNGTEILHTYNLAKSVGLTKMPWVPTADNFIKQNLHKRASFFGCDAKDKVTIIFLPNTNYTSFESNPPSSKFDYTRNETVDMIKNGNLVATQGNDPNWPVCLGCGIVHKMATRMPEDCKACLEKYCVYETK